MKDDSSTTFLEIRRAVDDLVAAKGWGQVHSEKNLSMSIAIEAAELMELYQWETCSEGDEANDITQEAVGELADILVYVLCFANLLDVDVSTAIRDKLAANSLRFPSRSGEVR